MSASFDLNLTLPNKLLTIIIVIETKPLISNLVNMTRFGNNLHQVSSKSKGWKAKEIRIICEQENQSASTGIAKIGNCYQCMREGYG